ncbi:hypothetical protein AX15_002604 [Amanita polypyramis BW_CC]|nr:hypothetical protein AX15_002604 [Amanita polypyramis BW_CC]
MYPTSHYAPRPTSPYSPPQVQGTPAIAPGTITYTTSVGPDGRAVYHPFKAIAASYQTATGVVHGIQWVPAEATQILPAGAQPATAEFAASWERGGYDSKYVKDRQREEEKRRRKKETEEAKGRERGRSFVEANAPPVTFPNPGPGYPTSPYVGMNPSRDNRAQYADLDRQFNDLDISGRTRKYSTSEGGAPGIGSNYGASPYGSVPGPYSKPYPTAGHHISAYSNPSPNMRAADVPPVSQTGYPASPYNSRSKQTEPIGRVPSPRPPTVSPYGPQPPRSRATTPIPGSVPAPSYIQSRSRAASPVPGYAQPHSRAASPMPGGMPLPETVYTDRSLQPTVPECFSRAVNPGVAFPPFDPIRVQDMDEFLDHLPKLPLVVQTHDVNHHDWIRLVQDLSLAWGGKMPIPPERAANPPKRSSIAAELLHAWNTAFFLPRGVEVVLYKGSIRFSGPKAGIADLPYKHDEDDSDDSTTTSESDPEDEPHHLQSVGLYGGAYPTPTPMQAYASEANEARRRRHEERRRRRKERRLKRKQREREKKYSLYVTYVPVAIQSGMPGRYPGSRPGGY